MASMMEQLMGMLGGNTLNKVSQKMGVPQEKAQQALPDIIGVLEGALAKNASKKQEAEAINNALAKDHDGQVLDNLSDYIENYQKADGDGILKHVLGSKRPAVEQRLSQKTGLDMGSIGNLLTMAAPLVMGMLGKKQRQQGFDLGSLMNMLGSEQNQVQNTAPGAMDILNQILGGGGQQPQQQQQTSSSTKKRSGCATVVIVLVIAVVVYFALRACGIL